MSFSSFNLNPSLLQAIQLCGYQTPTPVQKQCIPAILSKQDVVAFAQTGTGKTAAFVLPALQLLSLAKPCKKARILILTPTRELAQQITLAINNYGKFFRYQTVNLVGGTPYREQFKKLSRPLDFIVATPGRLLDHLKNHALDLSHIEMLILDESDRMLDMGFIDDVKRIELATPRDKQVLLFSATNNASLNQIIKQLLRQPVNIDLSEQKRAPGLIKQDLYLVNNVGHKVSLLKHLLKNMPIYKAIIFSATKRQADTLTKELCAMGLLVASLHSDLKQNVRNRTLNQFRNGKIQYLVATDVAARGLDINDISHIINFDLPRFSEDYVHRIGRTGRAGKTGHAISFALATDVSYLKKIESYTGQPMDRLIVKGLEPTKGLEQTKPYRKHKKRFKSNAEKAQSNRAGKVNKTNKKASNKSNKKNRSSVSNSATFKPNKNKRKATNFN